MSDGRCNCGGRIVPEVLRGVTHSICASCSVCGECDPVAAVYGDHGATSEEVAE